MRSFTNNYADQRPEIFLAFAIGYIVIVEVLTLSSYVVERRWRVA
jgi:glutamate transport system permease protein